MTEIIGFWSYCVIVLVVARIVARPRRINFGAALVGILWPLVLPAAIILAIFGDPKNDL